MSLPTSWLLIALGDQRQHAGNLGYSDQLASVYHYDSKVANHKQIAEGDLVLLRDHHALLGLALIERITRKQGTKLRRACPTCNSTGIKERKNTRPVYKCAKKGSQCPPFDAPHESTIPVTLYEAHYANTFLEGSSKITARVLRDALLKPNDQMAMQKIALDRLVDALDSHVPAWRALCLEPLDLEPGDALESPASEQHKPYLPDLLDERSTAVRAIKERRGQQKFRSLLLARYQSRCLISGCEVLDVIEAAHIVNYRGEKDNNPENGLLLRSDLHTLFDLDLLGIDPSTLRVKLHPKLEASEYKRYHNVVLKTEGQQPGHEALKFRWRQFGTRLAKVEELNVLPFRRLAAEAVIPYQNCVPLLDLKIAAGSFSEGPMASTDQEWVDFDGPKRRGLFIAQVKGESMNQIIPDGAWCLWQLNPVGTRQNRIVLAQHRDIQDPEHGNSFTVKRYSSEKIVDEDGGWCHSRVTLSPCSSNNTFQPMVFENLIEGELTIIAEYLRTLSPEPE